MVCFRNRLAWLCFASLCFSTLSLAAEPATLPTSITQTQVSDVAQRVELLQQRLQRLESENEGLKQSLHQLGSGSTHGVTHANAEMWNNNFYPMSAAPDGSNAARPGSGDWKAGWNHGLEWVSPDKQFKVHIGGRTQFDSVWYHEESGDALIGTTGNASGDQDGIGFRRARLRADATIYETIDYVAEYDFVNTVNKNDGLSMEDNVINIPAVTELHFTFKEVAWIGNIRVGNFKEPLGFEHASSSRFLNFMERSFNQDLFYGPFNNGFTPGIMAFNTFNDAHGTWALGLFSNGQNIFAYNLGNGEHAVDARVTYLPYLDEECHQLIHVGLSGSARDPDQNRVRYRARDLRAGNGSLATIFVDTGNFTANEVYIVGAELAGVFGQLSFQTEWAGAFNNGVVTQGGTADVLATGTSLGNVVTQGYYAEVHYFLTDDSREYEKKSAAFGRVVPHRNFRWKGGCIEPGAWQVLFRYAHADLDDKGLLGGEVSEYLTGLNWFLNPNLKIQANYTILDRDRAANSSSSPQAVSVHDGIIHGFGLRLAHDF